MKIVIIHGQGHIGVTYTLTHEIINQLNAKEEDLKEFFLPKDGPDFCVGCFQCFLKGEENCPGAEKVQPIVSAMKWADVIILTSPNYVLEMSGSMKNLMDHMAYRWVTHRPDASMMHKVGVTISTSAGAPAGHTVKSMAKQLKWLCVPTTICVPYICNAMGVHDLSEKKKKEMKKLAQKTATKVKYHVNHPHAGLRIKLSFLLFSKMQSSPDAAWNPMDRDWWVNQGWTKKVRPWKMQEKEHLTE